jgi:hypothetical protein
MIFHAMQQRIQRTGAEFIAMLILAERTSNGFTERLTR